MPTWGRTRVVASSILYFGEFKTLTHELGFGWLHHGTGAFILFSNDGQLGSFPIARSWNPRLEVRQRTACLPSG